jgi:hypothetical protein
MNAQGFAQQEAIQHRRAQQHRLSGWAQFVCTNEKCAVEEINAWVNEEDRDIKPFQAPNKCIRCGSILEWHSWENNA